MLRPAPAWMLALSIACTPAPTPPPRTAPPPTAAPAEPPNTPGHDPTFVGDPGTGIGGEPLRRPDRIAILTLLRLARFADLDRWLAHYQQQFELDPRNEPWALDAFDAFAISDPSLAPLFDAWLAQSPNGFAGFAARGAWHLGRGLAARGGDFSSTTAAGQLAAMREHFAAAQPDLERAIVLEPEAIAPRVALLVVAKFSGDHAAARKHYDAAIERCPSCYEIRAMYLTTLEPRWGGSYAAMDAYVAETAPLAARHAKLGLLAGFASWDRCRAAIADTPAKALPLCDAAVAVGDEPRFLISRANTHVALGQAAAALADFDRAVQLAPHHVEGRHRRHYARRSHDLAGAAEDLVIAAALDPTDPDVVKSVEWMIAKLRFEGDAKARAGDHEAAARLLALGSTLAPRDGDMLQRKAANAQKIGVDELARRVAESPDDFDLRLELDHALARSRRFTEVIATWDEYIGRKPDDARAWRERSGARWQAGQREAGVADMARACELGSVPACDDVPKMRGRLAR